MQRDSSPWRLLVVLLVFAAAALAVVATFVCDSASTAGHASTAPARAFTYDGHDLHWHLAAWQPAAGQRCATVEFDVTYSDGQPANRMTFQPCSTEHALPDAPLDACSSQRWIVRLGREAISTGTFRPGCD